MTHKNVMNVKIIKLLQYVKVKCSLFTINICT